MKSLEPSGNEICKHVSLISVQMLVAERGVRSQNCRKREQPRREFPVQEYDVVVDVVGRASSPAGARFNSQGQRPWNRDRPPPKPCKGAIAYRTDV